MRVGVVTTSYPREPGDPAGNFVAEHVDWLRGHGHRVEVVCAGHGDKPHGAWQPGVAVTSVPSAPGLFYEGGAPDALERGLDWSGPARFSALMWKTVTRRLPRWQLVFAHWLLPSAAALGWSRHLRRIPSLAIAHSGDVHLARRARLTANLARWLRAGHTRISFVSHGLRADFARELHTSSMRSWIDQDATVIPMGIHVARFRALSRSLDPAPGQPFELLFLGRLVPIKGAAVLLAALGHLGRRVDAPIRLTLAGDGPQRSPLEARARGLPPQVRVRFVGPVSTDQRDQLLAQADALVIPSAPRPSGRTEGMPVTALEALAAGVPVIASDTGGLAELPAHLVTRVAPGDADALAQAIIRHMDDRDLGSRVAAGMRWVETLDWDRVGRALQDFALGMPPSVRFTTP